MKLRLQTCGDRFEFAYSTDPRVRIDDYGSSVFVTQWAIFVPFFDGSSEGEWYLTIVPLSLSSAEVLVGRATLVWRVKLLNEDLSTIASHVSEAPAFRSGLTIPTNLAAGTSSFEAGLEQDLLPD